MEEQTRWLRNIDFPSHLPPAEWASASRLRADGAPVGGAASRCWGLPGGRGRKSPHWEMPSDAVASEYHVHWHRRYLKQRKSCPVLLVKSICLRKHKNATFRVKPSGSETDPLSDFKGPWISLYLNRNIDAVSIDAHRAHPGSNPD